MHPIKKTNNRDQENDRWDSSFIQTTPLFWPIKPAYQELKTNHITWPTLADYNQYIKNNTNEADENTRITKKGKAITFVPQGTHCEGFEDEYEPRIYCTGEVQTRQDNWHDFFQVMVWNTFPKTKILLNEIHYNAAVERHKNKIKQRGKKENFVTLFDECGTVILSSSQGMLDMVRNFEWDRFFIENKIQFGKTVECAVFGHAMYEKALQPYIGMTSHCLLLQVDERYFQLAPEEKTQYIDKMLSDHIKKIDNLNTKSLTPLPILGVPGWHQNQTAVFYENQSYFRPRRKNK